MRLLAVAALAAVLLPAVANAQTASPGYPRTIPSPGGEVIIAAPWQQGAYDEVGYAPARRAGDTLYMSGAIVWRGDGEGNDLAAFETQVRRTLRQLDTTARAAGATLDDVAMIRSFHVWESPNFTGTPMQQIEVISRVWREFSSGPRPAWTAVGTTGLLAPPGIVEIELTVHSPRPAN